MMVPIAAIRATNEVPRRLMPLYGVQIVERGSVVWAKKATWFRKVPHTAIVPHKGQAEIRVTFGELAKEASRKGAEGVASEIGGEVISSPRGGKLIVCPDGQVLPVVAAYIKYRMKGKTAPHRMPKEKYPSRRRCLHTIEELKKTYGLA